MANLNWPNSANGMCRCNCRRLRNLPGRTAVGPAFWFGRQSCQIERNSIELTSAFWRFVNCAFQDDLVLAKVEFARAFQAKGIPLPLQLQLQLKKLPSSSVGLAATLISGAARPPSVVGRWPAKRRRLPAASRPVRSSRVRLAGQNREQSGEERGEAGAARASGFCAQRKKPAANVMGAQVIRFAVIE